MQKAVILVIFLSLVSAAGSDSISFWFVSSKLVNIVLVERHDTCGLTLPAAMQITPHRFQLEHTMRCNSISACFSVMSVQYNKEQDGYETQPQDCSAMQCRTACDGHQWASMGGSYPVMGLTHTHHVICCWMPNLWPAPFLKHHCQLIISLRCMSIRYMFLHKFIVP